MAVSWHHKRHDRQSVAQNKLRLDERLTHRFGLVSEYGSIHGKTCQNSYMMSDVVLATRGRPKTGCQTFDDGPCPTGPASSCTSRYGSSNFYFGRARALRPVRARSLTSPVRTLYRGALRVLLVLLHDFPEFLCDYHASLCEVIPPSCIQMRNLVLSAFPRNMRLPDPFTPNLKVDLLPEIATANLELRRTAR